jgi:hypothetical protein
MIKTNAELVKFIKKGLDACSFDKYLGFNLRKGYHSTLGNSTKNNVDEQLRRDRKETKKLLENIRKTCRGCSSIG